MRVKLVLSFIGEHCRWLLRRKWTRVEYPWLHGDGWTRRRLETEPEFGFWVRVSGFTILKLWQSLQATEHLFLRTCILHFYTLLHYYRTYKMYLTILTILLGVCSHVTSGIFCYVCESVRDFRCLDPFDFQPFPQVHSSDDHIKERFCALTSSLFSSFGPNLQGLYLISLS